MQGSADSAQKVSGCVKVSVKEMLCLRRCKKQAGLWNLSYYKIVFQPGECKLRLPSECEIPVTGKNRSCPLEIEL